jgi:hypothetical protein
MTLETRLDGLVDMTFAEAPAHTEEDQEGKIRGETREETLGEKQDDASKTLKYHLLGPSLTKAGQDKVDQSKVSLRTDSCVTLELHLLTHRLRFRRSYTMRPRVPSSLTARKNETRFSRRKSNRS